MNKSFLGAAAALLFSATAMAQTLVPQDPDVIVGKLDNGLTYYIRHNELPKETASFYIVQSVGAILEEDHQNGLAHFLEHMAFNGTKNFPDKLIIDFLERHGVRFGANINAYTSLDETVYNLDNVPTTAPGLVDSALLVLHDWSGYLSLQDEEIDKERGVIREEWRTRSSASRRMYFNHMRNTMPGTQYAKRDVIGDTAIIAHFDYDALRSYYKKWYRPDLQCIIVVGDVDAAAVEAKVKEMWKDIPAPAADAPKRIYYQVPINTQPVVSIETDDEATLTSMQVQLRHAPMDVNFKNSEDGQRHEIVASLCASVINTRLSDLQQNGGPFAAAAVYDDDLTATLSSVVFVAYANVGKTAETMQCILDELERVRRYGINAEELQRVKASMQKSMDNQLANRAKRTTKSFIGIYQRAFLEHEPIPSLEYEHAMVSRMLPGISLEDVNNYIKTYFVGEPVFQISAMKDDAGVASADEYVAMYKALKDKELDRKVEDAIPDKLVDAQPVPATVKKWGYDKVYDAKFADLSNGIRVYFKPTTFHDNEIRINGYSKGGFSIGLKPEDYLSASEASSIVSTQGLGEHRRSVLQKVLTGKSASVSSSVSRYEDFVSGSCAKSDLETALQLLYLQFAKHPVDSAAYAAYMDYQRTMLANSQKDPSNIFYDKISKTLEDGNPYRRGIYTVGDLDDVDFEKARKIHQDRFASAKGFTFTLVGTFDTDSVMPLVLKWIGGLPVGPRNVKPVDLKTLNRQANHDLQVKLKMTTNKVSSFIYYHKANKKFVRKDAIALGILGRCLDMRYLESVREDEGGTYGVSARAGMGRGFGAEVTLTISFDTDPAAFERLRPIIFAEIEKIAKEGPLASDLDKVKKNLIKSRNESLQKNNLWVSMLYGRIAYGDDDTHYCDMVESISAADVQKWAKFMLEKAYKFEATMSPEE